ncbi:MAG: hypothetical protein RIC56_15885 [Pseudomonadales bacterium]
MTRAQIIAEYQALIADLMLSELVAFGAHPVFQTLARELAVLVDIPAEEAAGELLKVSRAIYQQAASVPAQEAAA